MPSPTGGAAPSAFEATRSQPGGNTMFTVEPAAAELITAREVALAGRAVAALLAGPIASVASATVTFDGSRGPSAPPPALGPYAMTPFPDDPRPDDADVVDVPNGPTGSLLFSHAMGHSSIGDGWADWSNG